MCAGLRFEFIKLVDSVPHEPGRSPDPKLRPLRNGVLVARLRTHENVLPQPGVNNAATRINSPKTKLSAEKPARDGSRRHRLRRRAEGSVSSNTVCAPLVLTLRKRASRPDSDAGRGELRTRAFPRSRAVSGGRRPAANDRLNSRHSNTLLSAISIGSIFVTGHARAFQKCYGHLASKGRIFA